MTNVHSLFEDKVAAFEIRIITRMAARCQQAGLQMLLANATMEVDRFVQSSWRGNGGTFSNGCKAAQWVIGCLNFCTQQSTLVRHPIMPQFHEDTERLRKSMRTLTKSVLKEAERTLIKFEQEQALTSGAHLLMSELADKATLVAANLAKNSSVRADKARESAWRNRRRKTYEGAARTLQQESIIEFIR